MRNMPEMGSDRGGIRGYHFRDMMRLIYDTMEDNAIYDGPMFTLLYIILRKIVGPNRDATEDAATTEET
jgi:hypothetical protein